MNAPETSKLMAYMASLWPSFKPTRETAAAWASILGGQDSQRVVKAVADFAINSETAYPPTPQEIFKALRQQTRPERRVAGKHLALPGRPETLLTREESEPWFKAVYRHLDWVCANKDSLDKAEEGARRAALNEAWEMMLNKKQRQQNG